MAEKALVVYEFLLDGELFSNRHQFDGLLNKFFEEHGAVTEPINSVTGLAYEIKRKPTLAEAAIPTAQKIEKLSNPLSLLKTISKESPRPARVAIRLNPTSREKLMSFVQAKKFKKNLLLNKFRVQRMSMKGA